MPVARRIALFLVAVVLVAMVLPSTAGARHRKAPEVSPLASFGSGLGSGSTIGPDGALYVTDGNAGSLLRIDRHTGQVTTYGTGLPTQVIGIGGAMDVAFIGHTAYVLVTLVSGDIVGMGPFGDASDAVGIYRLERDGTFTVVADLGTWSVDNPPPTAFFVTTGVQYSMQPVPGRVPGHRRPSQQGAAGRSGRRDQPHRHLAQRGAGRAREESASDVLFTELGPVPHHPEDGKVLESIPGRARPRELASGASMIVDVERGPGGKIYALSQGQWDGVEEGSPAFPNTGRLVIVQRRRQPAAGRRRQRSRTRPRSPDVAGDRRPHRLCRVARRRRGAHRQSLSRRALRSHLRAWFGRTRRPPWRTIRMPARACR